MEKLTDGIKTLLLASLGAASLTADKSRELRAGESPEQGTQAPHGFGR